MKSLPILLCLTAFGVAQPFPVKVHPVRDGRLFMLEGYGGNVGLLVTGEGALMIDAQFESMSKRLAAKIQALSPKGVRFLINSHWHFDHTEGNRHFGESGTMIIAHKNVKKRMSTPQYIVGLGREVKPSPGPSLPTLVFDGELSLTLGGIKAELLHFPHAHTDGDVVVRFPSLNAIHIGDLFFNGLYPFVDSSSGGRVDGLIKAVEAVLSLCDEETKIIPGHGPLSDAAGLKAYLGFLKGTRAKLQGLLDQGLSVEDILAKKPTQETDEAMGKAFLNPEQFVRTFLGGLLPLPR